VVAVGRAARADDDAPDAGSEAGVEHDARAERVRAEVGALCPDEVLEHRRGGGCAVAGAQGGHHLLQVSLLISGKSGAAAITSAAHTEPPGWIIATAPSPPPPTTTTRNTKKASEATTDPASGSPGFEDPGRADLRDAHVAQTVELC
jgi:hypothetical protein